MNLINNRNKNVTTLSVRYRVFVLDDGLKPIDKLMNITITVSMFNQFDMSNSSHQNFTVCHNEFNQFDMEWYNSSQPNVTVCHNDLISLIWSGLTLHSRTLLSVTMILNRLYICYIT